MINSIVVCVDYDDLLRITLPRNASHLGRVLVVTSSQDEKTKQVVKETPGVELYETEAFYRDGAKFNKGLALEEGFDVLGREGWMLIWDADILFPDQMNLNQLEEGNLYTAPRRILLDPATWSPSMDWKQARETTKRDDKFPGYFHLFNASARAIETYPWYATTFEHAGGSDGYFQGRWPRECKKLLPFEVLHLGPIDTNWYGRVSQRVFK